MGMNHGATSTKGLASRGREMMGRFGRIRLEQGRMMTRDRGEGVGSNFAQPPRHFFSSSSFEQAARLESPFFPIAVVVSNEQRRAQPILVLGPNKVPSVVGRVRL